jgi:hypothetical protein
MNAVLIDNRSRRVSLLSILDSFWIKLYSCEIKITVGSIILNGPAVHWVKSASLFLRGKTRWSKFLPCGIGETPFSRWVLGDELSKERMSPESARFSLAISAVESVEDWILLLASRSCQACSSFMNSL